MKAFVINKYGKNEQLHLTNAAKPAIQENEVLVEIYAASLNQLDAKVKSGAFKMILPYKLPLILGHDLAGVVCEVGNNVSKFKIGDEVYARSADLKIGTLTEFIAVAEHDLALKPKNLSMEEAASLPLVTLTAWQLLVEKAKVQKDHKVFIQAGSGGVGTIAIQLAKYLGMHVATTVGVKSFDLVKGLGADEIIDYKTQDFETILKDYDLVINSQDNKALEKSINIVKQGGQVISISGPPTPEFAKEAGLPWIMQIGLGFISSGIRKKAKNHGVSYSFFWMHSSGEQLAQITQLVEANILKPVIDKIYPFEQTVQAMEYIESGRAKGKVVVKIK